MCTANKSDISKLVADTHAIQKVVREKENQIGNLTAELTETQENCQVLISIPFCDSKAFSQLISIDKSEFSSHIGRTLKHSVLLIKLTFLSLKLLHNH